MRNLLKLFSSSMLILLLMLSIFSCNKEDNDITPQENHSIPDRNAITSFDFFPEVRNGRLYFETAEMAESYIEELRGTDTQYYPALTLNEWEDKIGFYSSRRRYNDVLESLEKLENLSEVEAEKEFDNLKKRYAKFKFDIDNLPVNTMSVNLDFITDSKYNSYQVGNYIILFVGTTQVLFPISMENEIDQIYHNPDNYSESDGVLVHNMRPSNIENRLTDPCPGNENLDCEINNGSSTRDKRLTSSQWLNLRFIGGPNSCSEVFAFKYKFEFNILIRSWVRGCCFGWKRNNIDIIEFDTGWGVEYDMPPGPCATSPCTNFDVNKQLCHGTGWAQEAFEIKYTKFIDENTYSSFVPSVCGQPNNVRWLYNWANFENVEVAGISCSIACFNDFCEQ